MLAKKKLQDENRTEEEVKNETLDGREGERDVMGEDARKWLDLYLECTQKQNPITFKGLVLCKWLCYQTHFI